MKYLSVCSGIEAASAAWHQFGWQPVAFAEIEPFPSAVLAHHYPEVPNLGDMTAIPERILSGEIAAPDILVGGTPCQAFSVAGLRNSLDDNRGQLSLTFIRIADAIDHVRRARGEPPCIIVWENVPGVLSTSDNAFGCFLGALAGEDGELEPAGKRWTNAGAVFGPERTIAWRILNAQYFGLAQRRRRVFVVASARDEFNPASILFEFDGLRRDTPPSRKTGKDASRVSGTLTANGGGLNRPAGNANELDFCIPVTYDLFNVTAPVNGQSRKPGDPCHTLARANAEHAAIVFHPTQDPISSEDGTTHAMGCGSSGGQASIAVAYQEPIPLNTMTMQGRPSDEGRMGSGIGEPGDPCPTIAKAHSHAVAQPIDVPELMATLLSSTAGISRPGNAVTEHITYIPMSNMQVRRLTPVECERLQGFPDGYTNIPWRKADGSPDGPRYKALGNSWAVPCMAWIGNRINQHDAFH